MAGLGLFRKRPKLSVLVVVFNIPLQGRKTLTSLAASYQQHIAPEDYEVIVLDNGSEPAVTSSLWQGLEGNFRLLRIADASSSPAAIINRGIAAARGRVIGLMVDGARLVSPGLLHYGLKGVDLYPRTVTAALGWYLGLDAAQRWAKANGYDATQEEQLLASIDWREDGYRLFEIAALDESSVDGWFAPIAESNALFMRRELWSELGGVDERFSLPGGGLLNLDLLRRALQLPGIELVVLLGEGTFHQMHNGVATNADLDTYHETIAAMFAQYQAIRGADWNPVIPARRTYLGVLPRAVLSHLVRAALVPAQPAPGGVEPPLGAAFDPDTWSSQPNATSSDSYAGALSELAEREFRAGRFAAATGVLRLLRTVAPGEHQALRLLPFASAWYREGMPSPEDRADVERALLEAQTILAKLKPPGESNDK